ncbi:MAG: C4-dicarboxylate ABC transporter, partial [Deltaproteobacteria bacterium]|nr:C4-dicarboxylate ABC transporter [Deltaproteobacteria bacterium]
MQSLDVANQYLKKQISQFNPVYFAMVMATGIVSISCYFLGLKEFSFLLFWINGVAFIIIWGLTLARFIFFPSLFLKDLKDHKRGPGFFTVVAATNVLGVQLVLLTSYLKIGLLLWWFGLGLWALCTYSIFVALSVKQQKPSLAEGIHGG